MRTTNNFRALDLKNFEDYVKLYAIVVTHDFQSSGVSYHEKELALVPCNKEQERKIYGSGFRGKL